MKILIHDLMQYSDAPDELKSPSLANEYPNTGPLSITFSLPSTISELDITSGILSQPMASPYVEVEQETPDGQIQETPDGETQTTFILLGGALSDGVLSQPMYPILVEETLTNDLDETLTNDLSEDLTGLFTPALFEDTDFFDGVLSAPMSVIGTNEFNCVGIGGTDASEMTFNNEITITSDDGLAFKDGLYSLPQVLQAGVLSVSHNGTYLGRLAVGECRTMCVSPTREPGFYTTIRTRETLSGQVIPSAGGYGGQVIGFDIRYKVDNEIYSDFQIAYPVTIMQGYPYFVDLENDTMFPIRRFYGADDNNLLFQSSVNKFLFSRRFELRQKF